MKCSHKLCNEEAVKIPFLRVYPFGLRESSKPYVLKLKLYICKEHAKFCIVEDFVTLEVWIQIDRLFKSHRLPAPERETIELVWESLND